MVADGAEKGVAAAPGPSARRGGRQGTPPGIRVGGATAVGLMVRPLPSIPGVPRCEVPHPLPCASITSRWWCCRERRGYRWNTRADVPFGDHLCEPQPNGGSSRGADEYEVAPNHSVIAPSADGVFAPVSLTSDSRPLASGITLTIHSSMTVVVLPIPGVVPATAVSLSNSLEGRRSRRRIPIVLCGGLRVRCRVRQLFWKGLSVPSAAYPPSASPSGSDRTMSRDTSHRTSTVGRRFTCIRVVVFVVVHRSS